MARVQILPTPVFVIQEEQSRKFRSRFITSIKCEVLSADNSFIITLAIIPGREDYCIKANDTWYITGKGTIRLHIAVQKYELFQFPYSSYVPLANF